ncbi:hypothetical protein F4775DRAFT_218254 [Biscogniauxia sp. FL1348]|nr:hypothetical protein F4775DRAFT_218254 [Biscogniauxia sp. FL1348]
MIKSSCALGIFFHSRNLQAINFIYTDVLPSLNQYRRGTWSLAKGTDKQLAIRGMLPVTNYEAPKPNGWTGPASRVFPVPELPRHRADYPRLCVVCVCVCVVFSLFFLFCQVSGVKRAKANGRLVRNDNSRGLQLVLSLYGVYVCPIQRDLHRYRWDPDAVECQLSRCLNRKRIATASESRYLFQPLPPPHVFYLLPT